jgi:hypothetical protein
MSWRLGLVVPSPPAIEETGAMVREIESRQGLSCGKWQGLKNGYTNALFVFKFLTVLVGSF